MGEPRGPLAVRVWSRIATGDPAACWPWLGKPDANGYGHVAVDGKTRKVHRVVYEIVRGPIPAGYTIDHTCHNGTGCVPPCLHRRCCNPLHLEAVTQRENIRRGDGLAAQQSRQDECKRGHDLTDPANLKPNRRGARQCRACVNEGRRERYASARAAGLSPSEAR